MNTNTVVAVALSLLVTFAAPAALAHGGATGIVKERMDLMDSMKESMKTLKANFKGDVTYDADAVRQAALVIRDAAGERITRLFPEGSLQEHSEAKAEIWQEWQRFDQLANRLRVISQGLHDAADNRSAGGQMAPGAMMGQDSMMGQGAMMGQDSMMGQGSMMGQDSMMGQGSMMGQHSMMGQGSMMGEQMNTMMDSPEHYAQMPVDRVFKMLSDNCSSCHTRFRKEDK